MVEDPERGEVVVGPMWSKNTDWYLNVVAGGLVEVCVRGEAWQVEWRELDEAGRRAAGEAFRHAHPVYSRIILRTLVRLNGLEGDPRGGSSAGAADAESAPRGIVIPRCPQTDARLSSCARRSSAAFD